jgi:hypothetical protein
LQGTVRLSFVLTAKVGISVSRCGSYYLYCPPSPSVSTDNYWCSMLYFLVLASSLLARQAGSTPWKVFAY